MANVLNRTTKQYFASVNTPDYPISDWIVNPDLSAVTGTASKYWTITGDSVTLMSTSEQDTVNATDLSAARDAQAAQMDALESYTRAFALVVLDEVNTHTTWEAALTTQIAAATSLANLQTRVAAITPVPTRTIAQLKTAVRNKLGS